MVCAKNAFAIIIVKRETSFFLEKNALFYKQLFSFFMTMHYTRGWKKHSSKQRIISLLTKVFVFLTKRFGLSKGTLIKNGILIFLTLGVLGSLGILGVFAYVSQDLPDPNTLTDRSISQTTKIYDRTGEHLLYEVYGEENRTLVQLSEGFCKDDEHLVVDVSGIPLVAVEATIAAEDRHFCSHYGFDLKGIARAFIQNIFGNRVGGSTITQQLVKNAILSSEKTMTRKIKELIISIELERRYSKDEILQIYFNEIGYGSTYYGIETASQNFFHKHISDVTLAEAATLAALPQATTTYLNNPDLLKARRDWILGEMLEQGFITQEELNEALLQDTAIGVQVTNIFAPHFVFYVKEKLEESFDVPMVEEGGLKVITSLDYDLQTIAEEEVVKGVDARGETYGFTNASLVALDPHTSQVLSMVGSKDFFDEEIDGQVNVATRLRQPGSSFKPIVYAKGFELGYTPNTILWDVVTTFQTDTDPYTPHNYTLLEYGPVHLRKALQGSLNIPAVKMISLIGVNQVIDFARTLGYTSFEDYANYGLSLVLGGGEVQLLEHANAYGVFANEGVYHEPVAILKVENYDGETLYEWKEEKGKQVIDSNVARTITNVLKDNDARSFIFGAESYLQLGDRAVAAKSGTTNDYHDAWTVGYVPSLVTGVWVGNNDSTEMKKGADGSTVAGPIWNGFMSRALMGNPVESFPDAEILATGKEILDGVLPTTTVTVDKTTGKLATDYTPDTQKEERQYAEYHSILHYVNPSDPLGPIPEHPEENAQYESWESAVAAWISAKEQETGIKITAGEPPTEYDDIHGPAFYPSLSIESPSQGEEINDREFSVQVNADAPLGVARVDAYIDGYYLDSDTSEPYQLHLSLPNNITRGYHTLKVVAYDNVDNSASLSVGIQMNEDPSSAQVEIVDPKNNQLIQKVSDIYTVVVYLEDPSQYTSLSLYQKPFGQGETTTVGSIRELSSPYQIFDWTLPEDGKWILYAKARLISGENIQTAGMIVEVFTSQTTTDEVFIEDSPLSPFE
ncbi:TPA: hypothetical protein DEP34_04305 [Candidatus Uhrbacteria bacterium]|uniref:peptidoglycan glycosyltransferase n=2 Tax=Candidatus Uhriibacteriota TaxID=1752732 RepID=A0A0G1Q9L9_9BACT|nr:MAG: Penicillin-binding protein, 1A family [Candidatus Uhrbacteria bacterium GW2011_GWF2_46_218]KKU41517.1 MAG: Penicillin-binding protein, 1A family [Candidatus Uhrbacteria bacterium GW2011_GWE2_46_68]HBK33517.1 hypothetical protein [Candidatus Uhrbacteria bacterium]HCB19572.1 hypothetical protein [Candidatus Uhrbacteria bacterium]